MTMGTVRAARPKQRTITAPNGAKVSTTKSTRYVLVGYHTVLQSWIPSLREWSAEDPPRAVARVLMGSNTLATFNRRANRAEYRRPGQQLMVFDMVEGVRIPHNVDLYNG